MGSVVNLSSNRGSWVSHERAICAAIQQELQHKALRPAASTVGRTMERRGPHFMLPTPDISSLMSRVRDVTTS